MFIFDPLTDGEHFHSKYFSYIQKVPRYHVLTITAASPCCASFLTFFFAAVAALSIIVESPSGLRLLGFTFHGYVSVHLYINKLKKYFILFLSLHIFIPLLRSFCLSLLAVMICHIMQDKKAIDSFSINYIYFFG
jgi:hypothetical protein